jgi:hypothetical protein
MKLLLLLTNDAEIQEEEWLDECLMKVLYEIGPRNKELIEKLYRAKHPKDPDNKTETEVLPTSAMIGMSGMQSGKSALELGTSQNSASTDHTEHNTPSPAPRQKSAPVEG